MALPARLKRLLRHLGLSSGLEEKVAYLVQDNIRMNQLLRELIWRNDLKRGESEAGTLASFDYQWRELPDGPAMPTNAEFLRKTPDVIVEWTRLPREWFPGKRVLDAGCGSGRWSWGLAELGARLTSVDRSGAALEATRRLLAGRGDVELVQQDLLRLELPANSFDLVWCFGVAHHTANPLKAIADVARCVRQEGWLFMMLYGYPRTVAAFAVHADYEEWRQRLMALPFAAKVAALRREFPKDQLHGYFDAVSPLINELVTWEWVQAFLSEQGFEAFQRTLDHPNHHFVARKRAAG